jgi:hypothetical protein
MAACCGLKVESYATISSAITKKKNAASKLFKKASFINDFYWKLK